MSIWRPPLPLAQESGESKDRPEKMVCSRTCSRRGRRPELVPRRSGREGVVFDVGRKTRRDQGPGAEASGVDWAWEPAVASSGWPAAALTHRPLHANHGAAFPPPLCHGSSHALFLSVDLRGSSGPRASVEGQASEAVIRRPLRFPRYREAIWSVNAAVAEQRSASPSKMIGNKTTQ